MGTIMTGNPCTSATNNTRVTMTSNASNKTSLHSIPLAGAAITTGKHTVFIPAIPPSPSPTGLLTHCNHATGTGCSKSGWQNAWMILSLVSLFSKCGTEFRVDMQRHHSLPARAVRCKRIGMNAQLHSQHNSMNFALLHAEYVY